MEEPNKVSKNGSISRELSRVKSFFAKMGPGVVTGAADDDPSWISTYSATGAALGFTQLWTVFLTFPLMCAVQLMCARLGLVTGEGLSAAIRKRYSPGVLWFSCSLLVVANVVNIGADLAGMAESLEMVTHLPRVFWLFALTIGILLAVVFWSYRNLARIFKFLTLSLFAYIIAAFLAKPDWAQVVEATFIPHVSWDQKYLATLLGILGTTITPYMFFWQSSQEVEELHAKGVRKSATEEELVDAKQDVLVGMGWAGLEWRCISSYLPLRPRSISLVLRQLRLPNRRRKRCGLSRVTLLIFCLHLELLLPEFWRCQCWLGRQRMQLQRR